jgi:SAM-dependent MidA family methyltransferase
MNHSQSLPEPSPDALVHSEKLITRICEEITAHDGSIPFRRYMEMALYEPALGYYVAGTHKIGAQGDFVTAPEISPLFSQCIAQQCQEVLQTLQHDSVSNAGILELGAGSGKMATEILLSLESQGCLPEHYYILDLSPDLKQRQKETLENNAPHLLHRVKWLSQLPEKFAGIIMGNEVLDAMPVDVFTQLKDKVFEHYVIWQDHKLVEQLQPASEVLTKTVQALTIPLDATPYTSEINPNLEAWFKALANCLDKGVVLLADYGYTKKEYYLTDRNKGTLICHYQHLVNEAPLLYSGLQDITANVDFTAVAESADLAGFDVSGFTSQATFLTNAGLENHFMQALDKNPDDQYKLAQQVRTLSLPSEMGERFKFIALSKNYNQSLIGFNENDQRYRL